MAVLLRVMLVMGGIFFLIPVAKAAVIVDSIDGAVSSVTAENIGRAPVEGFFFGHLPRLGQARFVRFAVDAPSTVYIQLAVPANAAADFQPRLVVYSPSTTTVGPSLPITQPASTIATVYPVSGHERLFERLTQGSYAVVLANPIEVTEPGDYYIAVYNAGDDGGSFRLAVSPTVTLPRTGLMNFGTRWWLTHRWLGFDPGTMFLPGAMLLVFAGAALYFHRSPKTIQSQPKKI